MNSKIKILIVEDDPASLMLMKSSAKKLSNLISTANNGKEGLELALKNPQDLIITDVGMPYMDGIEMSIKIREKYPDQRIIITSAFDDKKTLLKAIKANINNYIVKPVNVDAIRNAISSEIDFIQLRKENKRKEERIEILSKAVNASSSMIVLMNNQLVIEYVNPIFLKFINSEENNVIGKHAIELFNDFEYNTDYLKFLNDPNARGEWKGEFASNKSNGEKYFALATISAINNDEGEVSNFVQIFDDITEQYVKTEQLKVSKDLLEEEVKKRTIELEKALREAEAANEAKSLFLANISHELRTPLNGILGMTSILIGNENHPEQRRKLHIIETSGASLLKLINDLIEYSQIQTNKLTFTEENFNLFESVAECLAILEPLADRKGIKTKLEFPDDLKRNFIGDKGRIKQIITNLTNNSIKFTEKGLIEVTLKKVSEKGNITRIAISVKDTGIGIPENKLDSLFQSFSQLDNKLSRKYGGTGLGLSITKDLVHRMNGTINVKSEENVGSEFYAELELINSDEKEGLIKEISLSPVDDIIDRNKDLTSKILIAEDSEINLSVIQEVCSKSNLKLDIAENGLIAYQLAKTKDYDMIFMDVQMPIMNGFESTEKILSTKENSVIVGLTAHIDAENTKKCYKSGMKDVILKPVNWELFFTKIRQYTNPDSDQKSLTDFSRLMDNLNYNVELLKKLIGMFLNSYLNVKEDLKVFYENKDFDAINKITHKLKSELSNFEAKDAIQNLSEVNKLSIKEKEISDDTFNKLIKSLDLVYQEMSELDIDKLFRR